ncbi:type VI immunity family protein [Burkholderia gladioli]|uniref:type VI immunity family protein n=1 Tax=Burkholderia gladioli TaxID=28095 RepID=UPI00164036E3|nr:type VI immunity family protein [Burkholderia gladioli]
MTKDELAAWANDPKRRDTLPYGLFEPPYQKGIVGAALVVRGVLYFRNGYAEPTRRALVRCYDRYLEVITRYETALAEAEGRDPPKAGPMRWFYAEGEAPVAFDKSAGFSDLAKRVTSNAALVSTTTSADHKLAAGFYDFAVFCLEDWEAKFERSLDVMSFTVPRSFLQLAPGAFERLFAEFAEWLRPVHGHGGYAVNLPPMGREPNEASEYFWARQYGAGLDVGSPRRTCVRDLTDKLKTVDWLTVIDADLVRRAGGADEMVLPPDWYRKSAFGDGSLLIQAGVEPQTGVSVGAGHPPEPPAAYVLLNRALRPIVADTIDSLQDGTVSSTAPLLSTTIASEAWLRRFNVPDDELPDYWVALHKTAKLPDRQ